MDRSDEQWILCPVCGAKTRARLLPDTILRNFPLFCPKCRRESIINAELVGGKPLHLADARPLCHLKAPLGLSLLCNREHYHVIIIRNQPDAKTQC